jgi:hypothetical protein
VTLMNLTDVKHNNLTVAFMIAISIFGIVLSVFVAIQPSPIVDDFSLRGLTAGSAFTAVCILGIIAALFPSSCSAIPTFGKDIGHGQLKSDVHETILQAHHPSCDNYSTHILNVGNKRFCATCSGLLTGAIIALFANLTYFFAGSQLGDLSTLVWIGSAGVVLGLLQSGFPRVGGGLTRFFASIVFVLGTCLMFVSIDSAVGSIAVDLFFVSLSVLWILTKIALSQRDHKLTCSKCSSEYCK